MVVDHPPIELVGGHTIGEELISGVDLSDDGEGEATLRGHVELLKRYAVAREVAHVNPTTAQDLKHVEVRGEVVYEARPCSGSVVGVVEGEAILDHLPWAKEPIPIPVDHLFCGLTKRERAQDRQDGLSACGLREVGGADVGGGDEARARSNPLINARPKSDRAVGVALKGDHPKREARLKRVGLLLARHRVGAVNTEAAREVGEATRERALHLHTLRGEAPLVVEAQGEHHALKGGRLIGDHVKGGTATAKVRRVAIHAQHDVTEQEQLTASPRVGVARVNAPVS